MTREQLQQRFAIFLTRLQLVVEKLTHRRGRRPKELATMQMILSDADFRSQLPAITFTELETKFSFWLEA